MANPGESQSAYIGRLAPTPSGWLHRGHAYTFGVASYRARRVEGGQLRLRLEDLDANRCKPEYVEGILEDLSWLGLRWDPQPDTPRGFVQQRHQFVRYREQLVAWARAGWIYPSSVSRRQLREHRPVRLAAEGELRFPVEFRESACSPDWMPDPEGECFRMNWRWRVPDGRKINFEDQRLGPQSFVAGEDFGDFLVWSRDGTPSYEMAVVLDDLDAGITEVVRGEDLLRSTARQLLIYERMERPPPNWFHCALVRDANGVRLAKSYDSESVRSYRQRGWSPLQFWEEMQGIGFPEVADGLGTCWDAGDSGGAKGP